MERGQLSLEFLILVATFIALLVAFMPLYTKFFDLIVFTLDYHQAGKLIHTIEAYSKALAAMEDGSYFYIDTYVSKGSNLEIRCNGNVLELKLERKNFKKEQKKELGLSCVGNIKLSGSKKIEIKRQGGLLNLSLK